MPIVSQAQRGLFYGLASGSIKRRPGMPSKAVAKEFVASDKPGKLPARLHPKHAARTAAET